MRPDGPLHVRWGTSEGPNVGLFHSEPLGLVKLVKVVEGRSESAGSVMVLKQVASQREILD